MPPLLPFRGFRPDPSVTGPLDDVVCPPYDVVSDEQRVELATKSPYNFVRVEVPAGDYAAAAALFGTWKAARAWRQEGAPALYGYRMQYHTSTGQARETVGVMGALVLEPTGQGILPHEQTMPKDKTDRLELIRATKANTSPIWCLCPKPGLAKLALASYTEGPVARATDGDAVVHELWPIFDSAAHETVATLTSAGPLLVADGHHRYETALAYQSEAAAKNSSGKSASDNRGEPVGPDAVLSLVVELDPKYLHVLAIHRAIAGLPAGSDLLTVLARTFSLKPAGPARLELLDEMEAAGAAAVVTPEGAYLAKPLTGRARGGGSTADQLDSKLVDAALTALPPHELRYEHDPARALDDVRQRKLDAVVLCRPATVEQIAATASEGQRMPPKTTFFWPKPRSGLVVRAW